MLNQNTIAKLLILLSQQVLAYPKMGTYYLRDDNDNDNQIYMLALNQDHLPSGEYTDNCVGKIAPYQDVLDNLWRYNVTPVNFAGNFTSSRIQSFYSYYLAKNNWIYGCLFPEEKGPYYYGELYRNITAFVDEDFVKRITSAMEKYEGPTYQRYKDDIDKSELRVFISNGILLVLGTLLELSLLILMIRIGECYVIPSIKKKFSNSNRKTSQKKIEAVPLEVKIDGPPTDKTPLLPNEQKVSQKQVQSPEIDKLVKQAEKYKTENKFDEAKRCYLKILEIDQRNEIAWYQKGLLLQVQGYLDDAVKAFAEVLTINPHHFKAYQQQVVSHLKLKDYSIALKCCDLFIEKNQENYEAKKLKCLVLLAEAVSPLEKLDNKITDLISYIKIVINSLPPIKRNILEFGEKNFPHQFFHLLLIGLYRYQGLYGDAYKACSRAEQDDVFKSNYLQDYYVYICLQEHDLSGVRKYLDNKSTLPLAIQANAFLQQDEKTRQEELERAEQAASDNREKLILLFFERGQIHEARKEIESAIECYQRVLQYEPEHLLVRLHLKKLKNPISDNNNQKDTKVLLETNKQDKNFQHIPNSAIVRERKIFETNYSLVYQGRYQGASVAIKEPKNKEANTAILQEIIILKKCNHPNIITMLAMASFNEQFSIVMEYMEAGSLYQLLHAKTPTIATEQIDNIALGIAKGVAYLHDQNIIHRDLKSLNILMQRKKNQFQVKISDFGSAQALLPRETVCRAEFAGTIRWAPPEAFERQATKAGDIYSYGVVLWELIARKLPLQSYSNMDIPSKLKTEEKRPEIIPETCPYKISVLMDKFCWRKYPTQRPTAKQIVQYLEHKSIDISLLAQQSILNQNNSSLEKEAQDNNNQKLDSAFSIVSNAFTPHVSYL